MKIGCLINARLGSKRLPKKHLRDIDGKTAIERLLDRLLHDGIQVVIATGLEHENKPFEAIARQRKIEVFYGDPNNIPKRHLDCARKFGIDAIVSIDADDVLTSPVAYHASIAALRNGNSLVRTEGLPFGMNILWGYTVKYLIKSIQLHDGKGSMDTGWGHIFQQEPHLINFSVKDADKIRATLDYPEDLAFFRAIYKECGKIDVLDDAELCAKIIEKRIHRINKMRHDA